MPMHGPLGLVDFEKLLANARGRAREILPDLASRTVADTVRDGMRNAIGGGLLARLLGR